MERESREHPWGEVLKRRLLTIPAYLIVGSVVFAGLPFITLVMFLVGIVRRKRWSELRVTYFLVLYLCCEWVGIFVSGGLWLWSLFPGVRGDRLMEAHYWLQQRWGQALLFGAGRLFSIRFEVDGQEAAAEGPYHLFIRHASVADTVLAVAFVSAPFNMRLRYVLKRELLFDPCLDIVGLRIPNAFVRRNSEDSEREIHKIRKLATCLEGQTGTLIYPEGTRFTMKKRARLIAKFEEKGDQKALEQVRQLAHVLPPRTGGAIGLIEAAPECDVVFCVHSGFERVASFWDMWNGGLIGRTVSVSFWRVSHQEIPKGREDREDWLMKEWQQVDRWVGEHLASGEKSATVEG